MVKLLTIAVSMLFSSFTVMAGPLSGTAYQRQPFKTGVILKHSTKRQVPLSLKLTHDYVGRHWTVRSNLLQPRFASATTEDGLPGELTELRQHDAALSFPVVNKGLNLDLGLNIRFINGSVASYADGQQQRRNFSKAIPMFYAAALFDLPFRGLSAGFVGRHSDSLINPSFDYRAKLSYEWAGGLGLEGGWQHQQYATDEVNRLQNKPVSKGLFLDLHLRF